MEINLKIKQKKCLRVLQEVKIALYLHPLYGGRALESGGSEGGEKKTFKIFWLGVGEEKKMITFAARFGGNGV